MLKLEFCSNITSFTIFFFGLGNEIFMKENHVSNCTCFIARLIDCGNILRIDITFQNLGHFTSFEQYTAALIMDIYYVYIA